ncbi:hypothetical protein [Oceanivirga salmonicida]|uniref:hypothetical protein n=1 Tax=Oceanivirga salmonicida TaxID=1769291 RepID=UPI0012E1F901|nr:hypothetical protein [Oceanivirga salmonicida]
MKYIELYADQLLEIYRKTKNETFEVGYIRAEDEKYIIIEKIDTQGIKNGYMLLSKKDIDMISSNTEYLDEIKILMNENSKENILNSYIYKVSELEIDSKKVIINIIKELISKNIICEIKLFDKDTIILGFIKEIIDDKKILVSYFKEKNLINIDDIYNISINSLKQRKNYMFKNVKEKL